MCQAAFRGPPYITMSLFIGTLAFEAPAFAAPLRLGVLVGSLLSAAVGYTILRNATAPEK